MISSNFFNLPFPSVLPSIMSSDNNSTSSAVSDSEPLYPRFSSTREISLLRELSATGRQLIQHWLFAALLAAHLYTLPLIYMCQKLVRSGEKQSVSRFGLLQHARCYMRFLDKHSQERLTQTVNNVKTNLSAPFRTMCALWRLAQFIEQNHDVPVSRHYDLSQGSQPRNHQSQQSSIKGGPSQTSVDSPASASQVYHAALADGNTLDSLLSSFGPGQQQSLTVQTGAFHLSAYDQMVRKRPNYRHSSVQTIPPEEAITPRKVSAAYDGSKPLEATKSGTELPSLPIVKLVNNTPPESAETVRLHPIAINPTQQGQLREARMNEKRSTVQGKRCSVYERKLCVSSKPAYRNSGEDLPKSRIPPADQKTSMIPRIGKVTTKPVKLQRNSL